jgi:mannose-6-phosphate isomerase-like protein (cupin superfamily)
MELLKENEKGSTYQADECKVLYRNKGSIAGDNSINVREILYFITGSAKITIEEKEWVVEAPMRVDFPANTYHKIEALSDIAVIMFEP